MSFDGIERISPTPIYVPFRMRRNAGFKSIEKLGSLFGAEAFKKLR